MSVTSSLETKKNRLSDDSMERCFETVLRDTFATHSDIESQIQSILGYPLPYPVREGVVMKSAVNPEKIDELWQELMRYFVLGVKYGKVPMLSSKVDDVWHAFVLDSPEYMKFCKVVGRYIMHVPNVPSRSSGTEKPSRFYELYAKEFGDIPKVWESNNNSKSVVVSGCKNDWACWSGCGTGDYEA